MTFITHGIVGAGLFAFLFGASVESCTIGFILGGIPDTLDWFLWWLSTKSWMRWLFPVELQRWSITYGWFHKTSAGLLVSALLIAPLPHVLHDKFVHVPVLARKGENAELDTVVWNLPFGINLTRHDVLWLSGELQQIYLAGLLFALSALVR